MGFMEIIALIMQIITFIMGIFNPTPNPTAIRTQYSCGNVKWVQAAKVVNGELVGTVQQSCKFEGRSGGGLVELKQHLMQKVESDSAQYAGPVKTVANGSDSVAYSVAFEGEDVETRGNTTLTTSAGKLKHSFSQTAVYTKTDAQYVSGVQADMEVVPTSQAHWYSVTTTQSIKVKKPWFISSSYFTSKIMSEIEKQMPSKVIEAVNDMSSHL